MLTSTLTLNRSIMSVRDEWPQMTDGSDFDDKELLTLIRSGNSPFHGVWDVNLLLREIEENLGGQVSDIPVVSSGSNNYVSFPVCNHHNPIPFIAETEVRYHLGVSYQAAEPTGHRSLFGS